MLFVKNNDNIDFEELEQRIEVESARLAGVELFPAPAAEDAWPVVALPDAATARAGAAGQGGVPVAPEPTQPRSLWSRISVWLWATFNFRIVLRHAIAGVYAAAEAKHRVGVVEDRINATEEHLRAVVARTESLRIGLDELSGRLDALTTMMTPVPWRLDALTSEVSARLAAVTSWMPAAAHADPRLDALRLALADRFGGHRDDIKRRLAAYVEPLRRAGIEWQDRPVLDLGCGRGEWLEVLKENGLHAYGVDINMAAVERSRSYGLDARHADMLAHLGGVEDAARSAVTGLHVIEVLPFPALMTVLDEALRVLAPGGVLILVTATPDAPLPGATPGCHEPAQPSPLAPEVLRFIVEHRGFADVEACWPHAVALEVPAQDAADAIVSGRFMGGAQEYAIIARRP